MLLVTISSLYYLLYKFILDLKYMGYNTKYDLKACGSN